MVYKHRYKVIKIIGYVGTGILLILGIVSFVLAFVLELDQDGPLAIGLMIGGPVFIILAFSNLLFTVQTRLKIMEKNGHEIMVYAGNVSRLLFIDGDIVDEVKTFSSVKSLGEGNAFKATDLRLYGRTSDFEVNISIGTFNLIKIDVTDLI